MVALSAPRPSTRLGVTALATVLVAAGCAAGSPPIPTPRRDGGTDASVDASFAPDAATPDAAREDAWVDDVGVPDTGSSDAGVDAHSPDAAASDAGVDASSDAGRDAGPVGAPVIDGVVGASEWSSARTATSATATIWAGNQLTAIRALAISGILYVAIEGRVDGGNAMVLYLDGDPGGSRGVASLATLSDSSGALDDALSAAFNTPSTFRADVAWGTLDLSRTVMTSDDRTGFRDLVAGSASDFSWILSGTTTACTAAACEMRIPTAALGASAGPRTIRMFARIVNHDGTMSPNQTLPMDDGAMPRIVSMLLELVE